MLKAIFPALVASTLAFAGGTQAANVLDLSTVTCKQLFEGNKEQVSYVLVWLDAYYRDEDDPPVINFDKMGEDAKKLGAYCAQNPSHGVITAADELFGK